jgi:hypothetical protein
MHTWVSAVTKKGSLLPKRVNLIEALLLLGHTENDLLAWDPPAS